MLKIECSPEQVVELVRLRKQYRQRIFDADKKVQAAEARHRDAVSDLARIENRFIEQATSYKNTTIDTVFADGVGGFVCVTVNRGDAHGRHVKLTVEPVEMASE